MSKKNKPYMEREVADTLARVAVDEGRLLQLGWIGMLTHIVPKTAPKEVVAAMRQAYYLGCDHLWSCIMGSVLSEGTEPTPEDEVRMSKIQAELNKEMQPYRSKLNG